jgi:hypothetical protein
MLVMMTVLPLRRHAGATETESCQRFDVPCSRVPKPDRRRRKIDRDDGRPQSGIDCPPRMKRPQGDHRDRWRVFHAQLAALDESKNLIVIMRIYREMDVVCEQTGKADPAAKCIQGCDRVACG